jgi:predicted nucleotidyltransferase component of viral defense system
MINKEEIDQVADNLKVNAADIQRDYVNGWLLAGINKASNLGGLLTLKGGNALRKGYFRNTRYSKDLDFSTPGSIDKSLLQIEIQKACDYVSEGTGIIFDSEKMRVDQKQRVSGGLDVLDIRAYFSDFYGKECSSQLRVYVDVTLYDRLILPTKEMPLIHTYSDSKDCEATVSCVALEEILASKLKCMLQRRHAGDLFDYLRWLMFADVDIDRSLLLDTFLKKTIYEKAPGAAFNLLINLPVAAIRGLIDTYVQAPSTCTIPMDSAPTLFTEHITSLFGDASDQVPYGLSFFDWATREKIMNAGQKTHLMRLVYKGEAREIEPYSISYKERKGGGGGEYFYAYDRSGGTSGPSIKGFVPEKIESLEELDGEFVPRHEIEVAKAGDIPIDPYFHGRSRKGSVPEFGIVRKKPRIKYSSPKHRYKCTICGKTFSRNMQNSTLKAHKGKTGYPCYGSYGSYEGYR